MEKNDLASSDRNSAYCRVQEDSGKEDKITINNVQGDGKHTYMLTWSRKFFSYTGFFFFFGSGPVFHLAIVKGRGLL